MDEPPLLAGAVHEMVADPLPAVAVTPVGASGADGAGVTDELGSDELESPAEFVATTLKVYPVPLVRPEIVQLVAVVVVQVAPPGLAVTV